MKQCLGDPQFKLEECYLDCTYLWRPLRAPFYIAEIAARTLDVSFHPFSYAYATWLKTKI